MRRTKKLIKRPGEIFVSPDGGETVYVQKRNGKRGRMVSQSQLAQDTETAHDEIHMTDHEAVKLRRKYPALQKAWNRYKTVWHMVSDDNHDN
jgi:hypothetical protein